MSLDEIAIDGTKVRANAGRGSFKDATQLERIEAAVEQRLSQLKTEIESDPAVSSRRKQAAQMRAAREVKERAQRARAALEQVRTEREQRAERHAKDEANKSGPKVSVTDPEARNMRFPDKSVAPGYNAQIAAAPKEGIVLSVDMTDRRNDAGLAAPVVDDIVRRYGRAPETLLVDTHYATNNDIAALAEHAAGPVKVFAPPPAERDDISPRGLANRKRKRAREPDSVKEWRSRMATEAGQAVYSLRKLIERTNANLKNHGFGFLPVRGMIKAKALALWHALAHNLMAAHRLRATAA